MIDSTATKRCLFCNDEITARNRSREHVIRNAWLRELGVAKRKISQRMLSGEQVRGRRELNADQMMAGAVCSRCNNGWMNDLDIQVHDTMMGLAKGEIDHRKIPEDMREPLGRWALKTVCAFGHTDTEAHRHIPQAFRQAVRTWTTLPDCYSLHAELMENSDNLGVYILDAWVLLPETESYLSAREQKTRLKFGIGLGHVVFSGVCLLEASLAVIGTTPGWHTPIFQRGTILRSHDIDFEKLVLDQGLDLTKVDRHYVACLLLNPLAISANTD